MINQNKKFKLIPQHFLNKFQKKFIERMNFSEEREIKLRKFPRKITKTF